MKTRIINLSLSVFAFILLTTSCGKINDEPSFLIINGKTYPLNFGYIDDEGTDSKIQYRMYDLEFCDKETYPSVYFKFNINSFTTTQLATGNYTYQYWPEGGGEFSYVKFATDLKYDSKNVLISGNIYDEDDYQLTGNITIGKNDDGYYTFDINLKGYNSEIDDSITVTGHFEKVLEESSIYIK